MHVGTFENVITASPDTLLIHILRLFVTKRISAIPIIADDGTVLNLYEKYDVLTVAKDGPNYNLNMPVKEALMKRSNVRLIDSRILLVYTHAPWTIHWGIC
jgi:predicted transcriptional regulator